MIPNVRGPICKCKAISGWIGKDACQCHGTGCLARGIEMTGNQTFIQICHFFFRKDFPQLAVSTHWWEHECLYIFLFSSVAGRHCLREKTK